MPNYAQRYRDLVQAADPGASVSARGRKYIVHRLTNGDRRAISSVARVHYGPAFDQEIDTDLVATTGDYDFESVANDFEVRLARNFGALWSAEFYNRVSDYTLRVKPFGMVWNADNRNEVEAAPVDENVDATVTAENAQYTNAYGAGIDHFWVVLPDRLGKRIVVNARSDLGNVPGSIRNGQNPRLDARYNIDLDDTTVVRVDDVDWDRSADLVTTLPIEVYRAGTLEHLFTLTPARYIGQPPTPADPDDPADPLLPEYDILATTVLSQNGPGDYRITIQVPLDDVDNLIYPLVIDPSISDQISADGDDSWFDHNSDTLNTGGTSLEVGRTGNGPNRRASPLYRFQLPDIVSGSTVSACTATVESWDTSGDGQTVNSNLQFEDSDDPAMPTDGADFLTRSFAASTDWSPMGDFGGPAVAKTTPDMSASLQPIINRAGWAANNHVLLYHQGLSTGDSYIRHRIVANEETSAGYDPALIDVTYTAPAAGSDIGKLVGNGLVANGLALPRLVG